MDFRGKFLKIDFHTHILPENIPNFEAKYGGEWITLRDSQEENKKDMVKGGKFFRTVDPECYNVEHRLVFMERWKIDVQILCTVPVMFNYSAPAEQCLEMSKFLNDDIAAIVKAHPKRFIGLGTIPMQSPSLAIEELNRCMNELNFSGIQIGSHINDMNLSDPKLFPIFEECERLGAVIVVHPWDMMGSDKMQKYWLPWLVGMPAESCLAICSMIFGGVFEKLPNLKVCFGHGGGSFPITIGRIEHGFNCRPDLVQVDCNVNPREYLGKSIWIDSIVHDKKALEFVVDLFGEDYVIFGTDYPFPLGEYPCAGKLIETSEFNDDTKAKLLGLNCVKFLGKKIEDFY